MGVIPVEIGNRCTPRNLLRAYLADAPQRTPDTPARTVASGCWIEKSRLRPARGGQASHPWLRFLWAVLSHGINLRDGGGISTSHLAMCVPTRQPLWHSALGSARHE